MNGRLRAFIAGKRLPSSAREVPEDQPAGDAGNGQEQKANQPFAKYQLADAEQRAIDENASSNPIQRVAAQVADLRNLRRQSCNLLSTVDGRMNATIEGHELVGRFRGRKEGCDDPCC